MKKVEQFTPTWSQVSGQQWDYANLQRSDEDKGKQAILRRNSAAPLVTTTKTVFFLYSSAVAISN